MSTSLKIHHIIEHSTVNGPGNRFVVWTQGCPFHCDGCFNQPTHSQTGGFDRDINQLAAQINQTTNIRGITLTGGEPLEQTEQISQLLSLIRKDLDILLFSGYTFDEIKQDKAKMQILHQVDAALLGRYNKTLKHPFYGKKLVIHGSRIDKSELQPWLKTEIIVQDNTISVTGLFKQLEN